ncbi:hypothetical protein [Streptomyces sp. NPDC088707]|uniref:hypothetical protein n=1 Tax=Streptomyces sp. NPDC088707 TaxID=3365871 RepID=UPI003805FD64
MLRLMRTRTHRQLATHIQELHDRASNQERGRLAAEYRITQALELLKAEETELSTRLAYALTGDGIFTVAPSPDPHRTTQVQR